MENDEKETKKMEDKLGTNGDTVQLLEMAKEKLRWYAMEASEEEFDEKTVDALVQLIATMEVGREASKQGEEADLERFHAYCDLYHREETLRRKFGMEGKEQLSQRRNPALGKKQPMLLHSRRAALTAAAAGIAVLLAVGGTMGAVKAGEDGGFFVWLKKDGEGMFAVTSQKEEGLDAEKSKGKVYNSYEEVPEEYREYVLSKECISILDEYEFADVACMEFGTVRRMNVNVCLDGSLKMRIGVCIYRDAITTTERYDDYEYLHTNYVDGYQQDVFVKQDSEEEREYFVCFYEDNIKYFVEGKCDVEFLEAVSEEYLKCICDKATKKQEG